MTIAANCMNSGLSKALSQWAAELVMHLGRRQNLGQSLFFTEVTRLLVEVRPRDAGGAVAPDEAPIRVRAVEVLDEELL